MPIIRYCWRCDLELPMLTDDEWAQLGPYLANPVQQILAYRQAHGCSLAEAHENGFGREALALYEVLTGFRETDVRALFHHRASAYGPDCECCGKPLRTPKARFCAACGAPRSKATLNVQEGRALTLRKGAPDPNEGAMSPLARVPAVDPNQEP